MIVETQRILQATDLELLRDREQAEQFRRTHKLPNGRFEQKGDHKETHFDRFWATAYAVYGIREGRRGESAYARHGLSVVGGEDRRWRTA